MFLFVELYWFLELKLLCQSLKISLLYEMWSQILHHFSVLRHVSRLLTSTKFIVTKSEHKPSIFPANILGKSSKKPGYFTVRLTVRVGWFLIWWSLEFWFWHAAKLFSLLHWFQNCFCFRSRTFPSHAGNFFGLQWECSRGNCKMPLE